MRTARLLVLTIAAAALLLGCGAAPTDAPPTEESAQRHPEVVEVTVDKTGDTFAFTVTISSPYDTPERYADGWRVKDADGTIYGEHTLGHDHANEQPFTRTQTEVRIPDPVREVIIEGRDKRYGYGGTAQTVRLP